MDMHYLWGCAKRNRDDEKENNTCLGLMVEKRIGKGTGMGYKKMDLIIKLLMTYSNPIV